MKLIELNNNHVDKVCCLKYYTKIHDILTKQNDFTQENTLKGEHCTSECHFELKAYIVIPPVNDE